MVAPRSSRITYSGFYKGGQGARSDSKAADWNYGHTAVCHGSQMKWPLESRHCANIFFSRLMAELDEKLGEHSLG